MVNFDKIPKPIYNQLVKLIGKEEAEKYIKKENYNFGAVTNKIIFLEITNLMKKKTIICLLCILAIIVIIAYYFLDLFLII